MLTSALTSLRIGVDFDNTIVCYDDVFHSVALERNFIPPSVAVAKEQVRDHLRAAGREDDWTELQGYVYGKRMAEAQPFRGVRDFFATLAGNGATLFIISHKTKAPYRGPAYDLHGAARQWLTDQAFVGSETGLNEKSMFFEPTKQDKLARIARQQCTHFIDDLLEFLAEPGFPDNVEKIHFAPGGQSHTEGVQRVGSWSEVLELFAPTECGQE